MTGLPGTTELVEFTRALADASAQVIRGYFRSDYEVISKSDDSPVTKADREAEEVMRSLITARFPEHGILGEECGHYQPEADYQWVLDPIDGTKAFVSHSYLFGTLIALLYQGRPILGVIHHPLMADFLIGIEGETFLNGKKVMMRSCERIEDAILLSSTMDLIRKHQNGDAFDGLSLRVARHNNWGDCHGYYLLAVGGADIMADPIMNPWDIMALIPIIEGAGGLITDWQGNDAVAGRSIVAANRALHADVIRALNP
ncbi:MAG: histidinol-phosphatase [Verrucomicrobiaceae bacterium]|nr:histidinol-phosphatase [Verrucomicrobiaceae bacterium]